MKFFTLERDIEGAIIPRIEDSSSQVDRTHKVLRQKLCCKQYWLDIYLLKTIAVMKAESSY